MAESSLYRQGSQNRICVITEISGFIWGLHPITKVSSSAEGQSRHSGHAAEVQDMRGKFLAAGVEISDSKKILRAFVEQSYVIIAWV